MDVVRDGHRVSGVGPRGRRRSHGGAGRRGPRRPRRGRRRSAQARWQAPSRAAAACPGRPRASPCRSRARRTRRGGPYPASRHAVPMAKAMSPIRLPTVAAAMPASSGADAVSGSRTSSGIGRPTVMPNGRVTRPAVQGRSSSSSGPLRRRRPARRAAARSAWRTEHGRGRRGRGNPGREASRDRDRDRDRDRGGPGPGLRFHHGGGTRVSRRAGRGRAAHAVRPGAPADVGGTLPERGALPLTARAE